MANYTTEEIQAAVENLVQATIRRPYDTLGVRRVDISFSDIQQAAAGVFLLYPKAPFYCLELGARAALQLIESEAQGITTLLESIRAVGRQVLPVEDVSPLFNAKVALESLGQAAVQRGTAFKDITTVPAFQRFEKNVNTFLAQNGDAVREGGEIVETPLGAKRKLSTLVAELQDRHNALIERVQTLAKGEENYASVNLAALVAQGVLAKAASVLEDHANTLSGQKPEERLESLRGVVLDLIAAKSVVRKYGSFTGPTQYYSCTGTGTPYSDSSHLAEPARAISSFSGPYALDSTNNTLEMYLQGSLSPSTLSLPFSASAQILGTVNEQSYALGNGWIIGDGVDPVRDKLHQGDVVTGLVAPPNNNKVIVTINGTDYTCPLTLSADGNGALIDATPRTAEQVCADINAVINAAGFEAVPYLAPRKFYGLADITPTMGSEATFSLVGGFGDFGAVGIVPGMLVNVLSGTEAGLWLISTVGTTTLVAYRVDLAMAVGALSSTFEIGPAQRRIKIQPINAVSSITALDQISIKDDGAEGKAGAETLGLTPGLLIKSRPSTPKDLAAYINGASTVVTAQAMLGTSVVRQATTNTSNSLKLTLTAAAVIAPYSVVRIEEGQNAADYYVERQDGLDIYLTAPLPAPADPVTGAPITLSIRTGSEYLTISSTNQTTASRIRFAGTAASVFFAGGSAAVTTGVYGRTRYFRLPQRVASLLPNDLLLFYGMQYNVASEDFGIVAIEDDVLTLDATLPSNITWVFGPTASVPFARLQSVHTFDFSAFKARLEVWLARTVQQPAYFTDLNRFINPLIVNNSPTAVQIGDATNRVNDLLKFLTVEGAAQLGGTDPAASILEDYKTDYQAAVDALLRAFKEKGADRAYDFLIQGRFSEFFAMDVDTASYAGAMQRAMREVVRNDLPVRKTNRKDQKTSRLLSSVETTDPEYSLDDTEQAVADPAGQGEF